MSVAEAIRLSLALLRRRRRLTKQALASKAGVSLSTITNIEQGTTPRYGTMEKLAEALGVDPEDIDWPGDPLGLGPSPGG